MTKESKIARADDCPLKPKGLLKIGVKLRLAKPPQEVVYKHEGKDWLVSDAGPTQRNVFEKIVSRTLSQGCDALKAVENGVNSGSVVCGNCDRKYSARPQK